MQGHREQGAMRSTVDQIVQWKAREDDFGVENVQGKKQHGNDRSLNCVVVFPEN